MPHAVLIDGTDLKDWAQRRDAQSTLPALVRRLIRGTTDGVGKLSFPSGDAVQLGGWDGWVEVEEGTEYVPAGASGWELGTNAAVKAKADDDYSKRTAETPAEERAKTAFVFVTPRRWGGKGDWIAGKVKQGDWLDVRAYDGDDLASWMELAPSVHTWASTMLGKQPEDAVDIETYWQDWASATRVPLLPDLLVTSRGSAEEELKKWLVNPASLASLRAESPQEATAFFAAVVERLEENQREEIRSRTVVLGSEASWRRMSLSESPLILIPTFENRSLLTAAVSKGHHVLVPLGLGDAGPSTIDLARQNRKALRDSLEGMGVQEDELDDLASLGRRSLSALRRRMAPDPSVLEPEWSKPSEAAAILPALLAGKWADNVKGDREALAELAGCSYEDLARSLTRWANEADPFIRRVGDIWYVVAKEDSWRLLSRYVGTDQLIRLERVAASVLAAYDPKYDLKPSERFMGHCTRKSGSIRGISGPGWRRRWPSWAQTVTPAGSPTVAWDRSGSTG